MVKYVVTSYSPWTGRTVQSVHEAPGWRQAEEKAIGRMVTPPYEKPFKLEPEFIISTYPVTGRVRPPPCKPMKMGVEYEKPIPSWLLGAEVAEDEILCEGSMPVGKPELEKIEHNNLATFIYTQNVKSPQYEGVPARTIRFRRDVYRKFWFEAQRMAERDPERAVKYLIDREGPLTAWHLTSMLPLKYYTVEHILKRLRDKREIGADPGIRHRAHILYFPKKLKTETELLRELKSMVELEKGRKLTVEEMEEVKKTVEEHTRERTRQSTLFQLERGKVTPERMRKRKRAPITLYRLMKEKYMPPVISEEEMKVIKWKPETYQLDAWICREGSLKDRPVFKCMARTLEGAEERLYVMGLPLMKPEKRVELTPEEKEFLEQKHKRELDLWETEEKMWRIDREITKAVRAKDRERRAILEIELKKAKAKVRKARAKYEELVPPLEKPPKALPTRITLWPEKAVYVFERPKVEASSPKLGSFKASEVDVTREQLKKLSWKPSEITIEETPYEWLCHEAEVDRKTLVSCIAETPAGLERKHFYLPV